MRTSLLIRYKSLKPVCILLLGAALVQDVEVSGYQWIQNISLMYISYTAELGVCYHIPGSSIR